MHMRTTPYIHAASLTLAFSFSLINPLLPSLAPSISHANQTIYISPCSRRSVTLSIRTLLAIIIDSHISESMFGKFQRREEELEGTQELPSTVRTGWRGCSPKMRRSLGSHRITGGCCSRRQHHEFV